MPIIHMIYTTVPADQAAEAERNWKVECAPIMISQPGCLTEELLRCTQSPGEYISYSEWDNEANLRKYLGSKDHQEIKRFNSGIVGATVVVKDYEAVG